MDFPQFDLEKLKKDGEDAQNKKALFGTLGAVASGFDNVPSSYNLLYGKGQQKGNSAQIFDNLQKQVEDPWEKQKKTYEAFKTAKEGETLQNKTDPNSKSAMAAKAMVSKKYGIQPAEMDGLTQDQVFELWGNPGKIEELKAKALVDHQNELTKLKMQQSFQATENQKNRDNDIEKIMAKQIEDQRKKNDPQERLRSLSGTDKARYDNALMVAKAIDDMGSALDKNQNTFMPWGAGDNDYTRSERLAAEAYGRMQSGGAINKDEEKRFLEMLPRAADSKEIQRSKLLGQRNEMISRLKTLGFTPEQAGLAAESSFKYGAPVVAAKNTQGSGKTVVNKQYSPSRNQSKITYSDGSVEFLDGK